MGNFDLIVTAVKLFQPTVIFMLCIDAVHNVQQAIKKSSILLDALFNLCICMVCASLVMMFATKVKRTNLCCTQNPFSHKHYYYYLLLLNRVYTVTYLKRTMFLGYIMLQLFCGYIMRYIYCLFP
jgi:hypothetical protein